MIAGDINDRPFVALLLSETEIEGEILLSANSARAEFAEIQTSVTEAKQLRPRS